MPYPVDMFIRFYLSVVGHNELANPDDMEVLAALFYWIIATLLVGGLILTGYWALRRYRNQRATKP